MQKNVYIYCNIHSFCKGWNVFSVGNVLCYYEAWKAKDIIKLRKDRYKPAWQIKLINQMNEPAGSKIKKLLKWRKWR